MTGMAVLARNIVAGDGGSSRRNALTPILIGAFGSISTAAIVIGCGYGLGGLACWFLGPETRDKPLPQATGASAGSASRA